MLCNKRTNHYWIDLQHTTVRQVMSNKWLNLLSLINIQHLSYQSLIYSPRQIHRRQQCCLFGVFDLERLKKWFIIVVVMTLLSFSRLLSIIYCKGRMKIKRNWQKVLDILKCVYVYCKILKDLLVIAWSGIIPYLKNMQGSAFWFWGMGKRQEHQTIRE